MSPTGSRANSRGQSRYAQSRLRELATMLPTGARLPGERDLAAEWGVARMTLRKGIDALVTEGRLRRARGAGTFVADRPIVRTLGLTSFSEDMLARGLTPRTVTIEISRLTASPTIARNLELSEGEPVVVFARLRLADDEPIAIETTWIADRLVPGLGLADLDGSLYEDLADRYGLRATRAHTVIGASHASGRDAELLRIGRDDPCLTITMIDYSADERPLMVAVCTYRADRYQLQAELSHASRAVASVE